MNTVYCWGAKTHVVHRAFVLCLVTLLLLVVGVPVSASASEFATSPGAKHPDALSSWPAAGIRAGSDLCQTVDTHPGAFWSKLDSSAWIGVGNRHAPKIVYVFSDPSCIYCHKFWRSARRWVEAGKVQLRYILVDILGSHSTGKAAAILMSPNPAAALARHEELFSSGGIAPATNISHTARHKLSRNRQLLRELGFDAVPGIVERDRNRGIQCWRGLPASADLKYVLGPITKGS